MGIQSWAEITYKSLYDLWYGILSYFPSLIGALVVIIIGLIVASVLRSIIERIVSSIRLDSLLRKIGLEVYFQRAGLQINSGRFFGFLVYWFLIIGFLLTASDILQLWGLSMFLASIVAFVPNIVAAILILLAALILANFLRTIVRASILSAKLHASKFLGTLAWWVVTIFGILAALLQLGIATTIINTFITGLIAMIALAGGIAFGLGGKDYAAYLLEKLREETEAK